MPHTFVTGANSFVAAHVLQELIANGHTVTGAVRRASAGEAVLKEHPEWQDKLDFVVVEDYATPGAFDAIFQSHHFDHIIHTAAPLFDNPAVTDYDRDFLRLSVEGNTELLKSAKAYASKLQSIAVTGSINAITTGSPDDNKAREYTNESWNFITRNEARASDGYIRYCSSKKEAELAIWDFVKTEKPEFTITVFLPALIFGPPLQPLTDLQHLNYSINVVYKFFNGTYNELPSTLNAGLFTSYIDARDLATAHVRALTTPDAANKRFLVGGAPLSSTIIVQTLKGLAEKGVLPTNLIGRLPKDTGNDQGVEMARVRAEEGNEVLRLKFRSAEETFGDLAKKLLELEKKAGD